MKTELKMPLLTNKYTKVYHESEADMHYGAPHHFSVTDLQGELLSQIHFQEGPIKEKGVNGCCNEDLINMVIKRLECFQKTEFSCRENALAITKLEEALMWLRMRTQKREQRGVEGTHNV